MASRNASFHESVIAGAVLGPFKLVLGVIVALVAVLLLAWTIDWIMVFKVWPEGIERLKSVLGADFTQGVGLAAGQGLAPGIVLGAGDFMYSVVFRATGIHDMGLRFATGAPLSIPDTIIRDSYIANRDTVDVAMIGTQLVGVRLGTLTLMLPLLVLAYAMGAADGLTQRAIRRASGGRESGSLYHRAKHLQVVVVATVLLGVVAWPTPLNGLLVGTALAVLVGVLARMQWTYYKKHL